MSEEALPASLNTDPYWWEAAPLPEPDEQPLPRETDVAIVGAGFTGLSAALTLTRAGRRVQVFDKDRPGEGASSRNGGIASGNIRTSFSKMVAAMGLERAKAIYGEGKRAREDLARFLDSERIDCDFALVGRFTGATTPAHYEQMAREAQFMHRHLGIATYAVPKAEQHAELGTDFYHGGVVRPDIGGLHPGRFHAGLLAAASAAGAVVHGRTAVTGVRRDGRGFEVRTARGVIGAGDVLVCTNGYTGGVTPWLRRRIVPIPSQIIATAPLMPELMRRLMPKRRMIGESRNLYHYYRPSPDGTRIVFGGRRGAETDDPFVKYRHLRRGLVAIFPELHSVAITHSWWGYTGYTFDFLPKLAVHEGVHYACGFCGSGVVWARWLGRKAALRILGDADAKTVFDEMPFRTRPLYNGRPWFLPAMIGWYRLKDSLGM
ncbi:MAG: NAD(P)/FAD-dependent oxidoreductase [Kiloniellales bacterium]